MYIDRSQKWYNASKMSLYTMYCNADVTRKTRGIGYVQNVGTPEKKKKLIIFPFFPHDSPLKWVNLNYPGYPPCLISMSRHQRFPRRLHSAGCVDVANAGFAHQNLQRTVVTGFGKMGGLKGKHWYHCSTSTPTFQEKCWISVANGLGCIGCSNQL